MPTKNHLVTEALLYGTKGSAFLSVPGQLLKYLLSYHSILANLATFLRKPAVWLWTEHTTLCLRTRAQLPWLIPLEVGFGKSPNLLFHSTSVYVGMVASHLSLIWHCSGWQYLTGRGFPFHWEDTVISLLHIAAAELFVFEIMPYPGRRGQCPDQPREMLSQCGIHPTFIFSVIHHPSVELSTSWGGKEEERDQGLGEDYPTTLLSSLLWILWAKAPRKSLLAEPNPETGALLAAAYRSSCFTLGQLFLRCSWKEQKETTIRCDPAGQTVVPGYWEPKCWQMFLLLPVPKWQLSWSKLKKTHDKRSHTPRDSSAGNSCWDVLAADLLLR